MSVATAPRRPHQTPRTPKAEARYHVAFANLLRQRGYHLLARSHEHLAGLFLSDEERRENLAKSWVLYEDMRCERSGRGEA